MLDNKLNDLSREAMKGGLSNDGKD